MGRTNFVYGTPWALILFLRLRCVSSSVYSSSAYLQNHSRYIYLRRTNNKMFSEIVQRRQAANRRPNKSFHISLLSVYRCVSSNLTLFAHRPRSIACRPARLQLPSKMALAGRKVVKTALKATGEQYTHTHMDAMETMGSRAGNAPIGKQSWHDVKGWTLIVELVVRTCRTSRTG